MSLRGPQCCHGPDRLNPDIAGSADMDRRRQWPRGGNGSDGGNSPTPFHCCSQIISMPTVADKFSWSPHTLYLPLLRRHRRVCLQPVNSQSVCGCDWLKELTGRPSTCCRSTCLRVWLAGFNFIQPPFCSICTSFASPLVERRMKKSREKKNRVTECYLKTFSCSRKQTSTSNPLHIWE